MMDQSENRGGPVQVAHTAAVYRRIATLFLALTAGVLLLAAYLVFSRAEVVILSEQQEIKADLIVDVSRLPADGEVKGEALEVSDSLTQVFPAASVVGVDQPAEGTVRISSTLARAQTLIATTRLLTEDGTLFRIRKTVTVPGGGGVEVEAFATESGIKGSVPVGTEFTIPGLSADLRPRFKTVAVANFEASRKDVRMISQSDIDKAAQVIREKISEQLTVRLRDTAREGGAPMDGELISLADEKITTDAVVGADVPEFTVTVALKATGIFYDKTSFDEQVRRRLGDKLMDGRMLVSVDDSSLVRTVEKRDLVAGRANVGVGVRGMSVLSPRAPGLETSKLTGVTVEAALTYLSTVDGVASASIETKPFWVGRMPNSADRIKVEVR